MVSIQLKENYKDRVTIDDIAAFCREHLAPYAVPKYVEFKDEMPLTVTEKVFKGIYKRISSRIRSVGGHTLRLRLFSY